MYNILVNATFATSGGALTILNQFIENVDYYNDKTKVYYIFVPEHYHSICKKSNINIISIKAKKHVRRIMWDMFGVRKWCEKNKIRPDLVISLQNTGVLIDNAPQIVYLHQALPFVKESKWSILKKDERLLWFYKHIYKLWIKLTVKKDYNIVVQTEWMKKLLITEGYMPKQITVSKPNINLIDRNIIAEKKMLKGVCFFYPAAQYKYKNHQVIIEAMYHLKRNTVNLSNIKIFFTLDKDTTLKAKIDEYGLNDNIILLGNLSYEEVLVYYKNCEVILFPSYIETFGLPLIEASYFGNKIVVSDCNYSREVLGNYKLVKYVTYNDYEKWASAIMESIVPYKKEPQIIQDELGWNNFFNLENNLLK